MAGPTTTTPDRPILATYRLQLRAGTDLDAAAGLLPYLRDLGISHVYLSPILVATDGSTHGYDVVDPTRVDPALGGDDGFRRFVAAARALGLGVVVDIVPNHMATDPEANRWWREVLQLGRSSGRADTFDITWNPPDRKLRDQVLLPVLGDHYGRVLESGQMRLERTAEEIALDVYGTSYPLDPISLAPILRRAAGRCDSPFLGLVARALELVDATSTAVGADDRELLGQSLLEAADQPEVAAAIDEALADVSADPALLHELLERQHHRLARWRTASEEVDYRRFFDITGLVGVLVEHPTVFRDTHACIAAWIADGLVDGLRVDHPDGLGDPAGYVADLRALVGDRCWVVVEKILQPGETLPPWPVGGTTGYDFLAQVTGLFVSEPGYERLRASCSQATHADPDFDAAVRRGKLDALHRELASEVRRITDVFVALCEEHPRYRDFTRRELHEALEVVLACFPVYRTYVRADAEPSAADRKAVEVAVAGARNLRADIDTELLDVLASALLGRAPFRDDSAAGLRRRFQQLSGAVMAKGNEDTALYRYPVLLAANDVGGDPAAPARSVDDFHRASERTVADWPATMLTLSTHDTKRSDDVRARLAVLSELPDEWEGNVASWSARLAPAWGDVEPDPTIERLLLQTVVGAHPISRERTWAHLEKAAREAGSRTSWLHNDETYESALRRVVDALHDDSGLLGDIGAFVDRDLLVDGRANALAQRLLLLTAPGVPDLYQGSELWTLDLVDPDNRRPVDFVQRAELLASTTRATGPGVHRDLADDHDGVTKLAVTHAALRLRRQHPAAFGPEGTYERVDVSGATADHAVAFARSGPRDDAIVTVAARLHRTRRAAHGGWADGRITLPPGSFMDVLTSSGPHAGAVPLASLLGSLPVALLVRTGPEPWV